MPSSQEHHPSSHAAPSKVPGPMDAHSPESLCQARTRLAPCHLIFGLSWASLGCLCTPIWAGFSSVPGMVGVHVARWNRAELCLVGAPITPFLGYSLRHLGPF